MDVLWQDIFQGLLSHSLDTWFQKWFSKKGLTKWEEQLSTFLRTEHLNLFSVFNTLRKLLSCSADSAKDGTRKNWQFCTRKLSGIFVPLSGRICARDFCPTIWTYKNLVPGKFSEIFVPLYSQRWRPKNCQCCSRKFSGIFVPLSGRICARGFCPTIWTYIASRKIFREFCPTILPKMAPEKLAILYQKTFRDFCSTIWAYLCQGLLSHYLDVYCQQENFQRFLSHYTAKDGTRKIGNFVPENFQGFLFHYLGVFVPGTSVPLSGRIRIWFQENFQRFLSHYTAKDGAQKKIDNFAPENFQGFSSHYLGVFVPGTSVPLSGRILPKMAPKKWPIWFQENFQRFLSHYLGVYWGRWRPKNGHLVLKGIFSEAAAAAFSVFSNMVDCSYFAFFDAFVVCCLRPSPSSSSWTSPP